MNKITRIKLLCPVCKAVMDTITNYDGKLGGMGESLLGGDARRSHLRESPDCAKHSKWSIGWDTETNEVECE